MAHPGDTLYDRLDLSSYGDSIRYYLDKVQHTGEHCRHLAPNLHKTSAQICLTGPDALELDFD